MICDCGNKNYAQNRIYTLYPPPIYSIEIVFVLGDNHMSNLKKNILTSAIIFASAFPLYAEKHPYEVFTDELKIVEAKSKENHDPNADVHIRIREMVDFDAKRYYEGKIDRSDYPGLENLIFGFVVDTLTSAGVYPQEKIPTKQWYDQLDELNKVAKENYKKNFNICLDIASIEPWKHEKAYSVPEVMQELQFYPPKDADIVVGITGTRPWNPLQYVAGQADPEGNHMTIMTDRTNGTLIYIHEMGHMFKAYHIKDSSSIMYTSVNFSQRWDPVSIAAIKANKKRSWEPNEECKGLYALTEKWDEESVLNLKRVYRLIGKKEFDNSLKELEPIIEKNQNAGHLYYVQGMLYGSLDKDPESIVSYEKAYSLGTKYSAVENNLAYTYCEQEKNLEKALELALDAVKKKPANESYLDTLGWAYYHNGKYAEAETELLKIKRFAETADYQYHIGMTYDKLGKKKKAREAFNKVIEFDKDGKLKPKAEAKLKELK